MAKFYVTTGAKDEPSRLREIVTASDARGAVSLAIRKALQENEQVTLGRFIMVGERGFQEDENDPESFVFMSKEFFLTENAPFS